MPDLDAIKKRHARVLDPRADVEAGTIIQFLNRDVPALLDEIERLKEDLTDAERYMNRDRKIALKFSAERDEARARLDAVRALIGRVNRFGGDVVINRARILRALDGESTRVERPCSGCGQTVAAHREATTVLCTTCHPAPLPFIPGGDDDCGGWVTSENPPCGGCTACLRAQDNHRQLNSESTKDGE